MKPDAREARKFYHGKGRNFDSDSVKIFTSPEAEDFFLQNSIIIFSSLFRSCLFSAYLTNSCQKLIAQPDHPITSGLWILFHLVSI